MLSDWLIITTAVVIVIAVYLFFGYVLDLFAYAANRTHEEESKR